MAVSGRYCPRARARGWGGCVSVGSNSRLGESPGVRWLQGLGKAQGVVIPGGETADGCRGGVGGRAIQGRARPVLRDADDSRAGVAARDIVIAGDHGGRGDGDAGVGQGGRGTLLRRIAGLRSHVIAGHGRGRIGGRIGGRGRVLRPGIGKLRRVAVLVHVVLVERTEPHAPVRAVVILNDHRHGE